MARFEFDPKRLKLNILMNNREADSEEFRKRVKNAMIQAGIETLALIRASKFMPKNLGTLRQSFVRKEKFNANQMEVIVSSSLIYAQVMEGGRKPGARMPPDKEIREWVISKGLLSKAIDEENESRKQFKQRVKGFKAVARSFSFKRQTQSLSKFKARTSVGLLGKVIKASEKAQARIGKKGVKDPLKAVNLNTAAVTDVANILDSLVFLIRRSIGAKGIEAHDFIARVFKVMLRRYRQLVLKAVGR